MNENTSSSRSHACMRMYQLAADSHPVNGRHGTRAANDAELEDATASSSGLHLYELPDFLQQTAHIELARIFCKERGHPLAKDFKLAGFSNLSELLSADWIVREPGYSIGYLPGVPVIREMWRIDPALCLLLKLSHRGGTMGQGNMLS